MKSFLKHRCDENVASISANSVDRSDRLIHA